MRAVRKRFHVLLLSVIAAGIAVPVGFALSFESGETLMLSTSRRLTGVSTAANPPATDVSTPISGGDPSFSDAAKLFGVGVALLGVGAVVRKAVSHPQLSAVTFKSLVGRSVPRDKSA